MNLSDDLLADCALVVAHPDDEILWFSSVLRRVQASIVCFLDYPKQPDLKLGRLRTFEAYPIPGISCLELDECGSFNLADWEQPEPTHYGLRLVKNAITEERYRHNFDRLVQRLGDALEGAKGVITHNPWGEYGHEDHVQVYAAVRHLQQSMGFRVFYTSYASNRSLPLLLDHFRGFGTDYCRMETDVQTAEEIAAIYKANDCWTWYLDHKWFDEEFFVEDVPGRSTNSSHGAFAPINMVKVDFGLQRRAEPATLANRVLRRTKRVIRRLGHV